MNFARDVVDAAPPARRALVALGRDGSRAEWSFGEVAEASARAAGALAARGVGRGDVVMTLVGNRPEWVLAMLACFRIGAVVAARAPSSCARATCARGWPWRSRGWSCATSATSACSARPAPDADVLVVPGPELTAADPVPAVELGRRGPVPGHLHLRHRGRAEGGPARPALPRRPARSRPSTGSRRPPTGCRGAPRRRAGRSPPATCSSPRGCAARRRCCTTRASTPTSGSRSSSASRSTRSAWRRPSTA